MEKIKIQINHTTPITISVLSPLLYDEIGEEYNIELDTIKGYFDFEYVCALPNDSFISIVTFQLPKFELRDIELKDIVFSFLSSVKNLDNVISVVKLNDSILKQRAFKYYQQIVDIEMDLRNVLTYIITYDNKSISEQLLKDFGINKSEKIEHGILQDKYENGLFYIYFNHYTEFTTPEKLKANEMLDFLQDPSVDSFERFKSKLQQRGLQEERHLDFLASIKTKIKPLEKMRNTIMHIRNLSDTVEDNFIKATEDTPMGDKGLKSIIHEFWEKEKDELSNVTIMELGMSTIEELFENSFFIGDLLDVSDACTSEYISEEYTDVSDLQDDLLGYITDEVNILQYDISEEMYGVFLSKISLEWEKKEDDL
ncbi:MAG: Unknown protein [uncultured Sulfurovum sp.]|uniref:Uncharacterized protein n=1 Tax=uncultured Sulfurovum sp. TaxID=269237 RepID=A0A6S6T5P0_9BACT|nr:MAG: Unknown protein [uncultured Sulfurovum sp.]